MGHCIVALSVTLQEQVNANKLHDYVGAVAGMVP